MNAAANAIAPLIEASGAQFMCDDSAHLLALFLLLLISSFFRFFFIAAIVWVLQGAAVNDRFIGVTCSRCCAPATCITHPRRGVEK
jgi:hypothetical protein